MPLEMIRLHPAQDYDTPFDDACDGFNQRWWTNSTLASKPLKDDCWSFFDEGNEVARAVISSTTIDGDNYEGLENIIAVRDIDFFEVRRQYRRKGLGREAAALLVDHYQRQVLSAFPIDESADSFWSAAGFVYFPRKDQADIRDSSHRSYDPLFLHGVKV
ncbi:GNAT family N-acetyltransferase [Bifidobacterium pseudolongum subsp. globosum]|uniref:hypothetical protein n=1 Tax=Bifidobacterium pseudolongum TaxID=1694 RepID=UPI0018DF5DBE|nr:hypothetical protein [Bifidobacterium pseudolongum]MCI1194909.1 GNAT family N-acetyltransferase [Bifidobacterium pseudolongum subsp. globosum]UNP93528.1 GNAT family N-acetyltransferase [Bifidobacterium pseudolongum subsp. globosum]UNZ10136.1 GNAT family N-acetyltransferase [Bifidobacterium pseudolongum subsp. globosum]